MQLVAGEWAELGCSGAYKAQEGCVKPGLETLAWPVPQGISMRNSFRVTSCFTLVSLPTTAQSFPLPGHSWVGLYRLPRSQHHICAFGFFFFKLNMIVFPFWNFILLLKAWYIFTEPPLKTLTANLLPNV